MDASEGILGIEWIEGKSVRRLLPGGAGEDEDELEEEDSETDAVDLLQEYDISVGTCSPSSL